MSPAARPLLIATLPARSVDEARREAKLAASAGADVAEVRFDRWSPAEWPRCGELFPSPLPLLATLRSRAEGGDGPDDAADRARWRDAVREHPFAWIDAERGRDLPLPSEGAWRGRWMVSSHLPSGAPRAAIDAALAPVAVADAVPKVVVPASLSAALSDVLPALRACPVGSAIALTTGPSGPLLRAWAARLGLPAVYGALPETPTGGNPPRVEPSQIPIDRLRRFFSAPDAAPFFAVVGRPVGHSLSPALHHFWMEREGRRGLYIPLEPADDQEFGASIGPLAEGGFAGVNATHPFKDAALRFATEVGASARLCGCANTLSLRGKEVVAENTDLSAIRRRLRELRADRRWDGDRLLVVGAGGAARATLAAARELGGRSQVLARRHESAVRVAETFGAEVAPEWPEEPVSVIVHATTVGRREAGSLGVSLDGWIGPSTTVLDFVYHADAPALGDLAAQVGARYEDGGRLLAYAAAASYGIWWGSEPSEPLVEAAVRAFA